MRRIGSKNTKIEWAVRRMLFAAGYRYRIHPKDLPGKPDIIFRGRKLAIFIHGCFWHQHRACTISHIPKSRSSYWCEKLERNVRRDAEAYKALKMLGWQVLTIWECETADPQALKGRLFTKLGPVKFEQS
ncbi:very short patch repair endonuclease [Mesorhizobium sp. M0029]